MANPALPGARAEDTGCSCHTSAAHPVLGTRLEPAMPGSNACVLARSCILSPLPNKLSAEAVRPSPPTPCNTQTLPDLPTCLPFPVHLCPV